jgi:hypothetical protein
MAEFHVLSGFVTKQHGSCHVTFSSTPHPDYLNLKKSLRQIGLIGDRSNLSRSS